MAAVDDFVAVLSEEQRTKAIHPFTGDARIKWHFLPGWMHNRRGSGISLGELNDTQRAAFHRVLQIALSDRGYLKSTAIIALDDLLRELSLAYLERHGEQPRFGRKEAEQFGSEYYWFTVFRDSADSNTWGWRLEGHHLSLNFTISGGLVVGTPLFMGADPAKVPSGRYAGWRVLAAEEDLGRSLVSSLSASQNHKARLSENTPNDVITGPRGAGRLESFEGISAAQLSPYQQRLLRAIVEQYLGNLRQELVSSELEAIEWAGFRKVYFAWSGNIDEGKPFYYRVHGRTFVIEFDHTDNDPNHIHSVWHGKDDFASDLLRTHYKNSPHHQH